MSNVTDEKGFSPLQVRPSTHRRFRVLAAMRNEDIYKLADKAADLLEREESAAQVEPVGQTVAPPSAGLHTAV